MGQPRICAIKMNWIWTKLNEPISIIKKHNRILNNFFALLWTFLSIIPKSQYSFTIFCNAFLILIITYVEIFELAKFAINNQKIKSESLFIFSRHFGLCLFKICWKNWPRAIKSILKWLNWVRLVLLSWLMRWTFWAYSRKIQWWMNVILLNWTNFTRKL